MITKRRVDLLLLVVSVASLVAGGAMYWLNADNLATRFWFGGAALVLAAMLIDIVFALKRGQTGLDVLALIAVGGALWLGEHLAGVVIAVMFASGRALESFAEARATRDMSALLARVPRVARRYEGDRIVDVAVDAVLPGDRLLVAAGDSVPADGSLLSASALLDESVLTGESMPVARRAGASLASGVVNAGAAFEMRAAARAADSTFAGIVKLVQSAQQSKAPAARLADRYALWFVPLVLVIAGLAWAISGDAVRALAVVVVATPCPLILAVPVAIVCAMSRCARHGILIKHGGALEKLAQAKTMFFDKTGTLTGGQARLVAIATAPERNPDQVLALAASLDQMSSHAIAQAVVRAAHERDLPLSRPMQASEEAGAGMSGMVDGRIVRVGGYGFVAGDRPRPAWLERFHRRIGFEGATGVYVAIDGELAGALQLADAIRTDTPRALRLLRVAGVARIVMLTGDRREIADTIGRAVGVDQVLAEQTPPAKLRAIEAARTHGVTIMAGDGINDAPALAAADVGVAMGVKGAAAAAEAAQVVLLADRLDRLAFALRVARGTRRIALQSVFAGMGLSGIAMIVAAFGYLPPVAGAVLQELIDVAVILNALRVLRLESMDRRPKLAAGELEQLRHDHAVLLPIIDQVAALAERVAVLSAAEASRAVAALDRQLRERLLPHETQDEARIYPHMARLVGGDDPLAAMSSTHREIGRLARTLERIAAEPELPDDRVELQRTLYALDAILRLHFAQEEELYHNLS